MSVLLEGRAEFNDGSPELTPECARARFEHWFADQEILSELVAIGHIIPNEADRRLLLHLQTDLFVHRSYDRLLDPLFSHPDILDQKHAFEAIVAHDMERVGISAEGNTRIEAGKITGIVWHPDYSPFVRWAVSFGEGSTLGATGPFRRTLSHSPEIDGLLDDGTLKVQKFAPWTVVRFLTGDVHRSPESHTRIFMNHTVREEYFRAD